MDPPRPEPRWRRWAALATAAAVGTGVVVAQHPGKVAGDNRSGRRQQRRVQMMTVTTQVQLREGAEPEWDAAIRTRLDAARGRTGWIRGQILMPLDALNERVVVGTWATRADWEAWHNDPSFLEARQRLEGLQAKSDDPVWHEVIAEVEP